MEGLRFECQPGCTACCEQRGFVYVTDADIVRAAEFLGMTSEAFERRFVFRTSRRARLRVPRDASCHFLVAGGCSIHPAKPVQCRIFPFWPELVESRREWHKTARYCPGIGKGPLVQIEAARELAREMRAAHPALY
ncbi:MAG TPA: YkgJ family cysteine cluster protein [Bryobacteraceae bacterium]|nr:YkgJ family cysteine cluster protein [Bryobacteraceae bacterium]